MSKHISKPRTALMSVYAGVATEREREQVRQYIDQLSAALAAATARAEAAERDAADVRRWADAVPVEALRRYFEQSDAYNAVKFGKYDAHQGMSDCHEIEEWLAQQGEVQP